MRALVLAIAAATMQPALAATQPAHGDAAARLMAATRAAVARSPELGAVHAHGEAARASAAAAGAAGSPYAELQAEGIGPGLSKRPNAQGYVRFGLPFNLPWQSSAARELRDATATTADAELACRAIDVASRAAALWLELAAAEHRLVVATRARERLDRALALHEEKLSLGEVAGFDVVQLDLEQVRATTSEARAQSARDVLLASLRRVAGEQAPAPLTGDLELLVATTSTPLPGQISGAALDATPQVALAVDRAAAATAHRDLVAVTAWGRPSAEAEWEHVPRVDGMPGFDALGLLLNVPLPLGRAVREPKLEAQARARAAAAEVELVRRKAALEADADVAAAVGAERRLTALAPVLDRLEEAERSLAEQFRLGAQSYLVYLDGMARFDDIRLDAVDARADLLHARLRLAGALARPDLFPIPVPPEVSP